MRVETKCEIVEIIDQTYNVKSFRVRCDKLVSYKAGQFMTVSFDGSEDMTRYLSLSSSPTQEGFIEFTKKLTDSAFSKRLRSTKNGDSIFIKYPYGRFTFEGEHDKITFLSGGIGITPIMGIARYIRDKKLNTDAVLFYGNRTEKDIAFYDELKRIENDCPNFRTIHIISQSRGAFFGRKGHIDVNVIKEETPDYADRRFYICGPPNMVSSMKGILLDELKLDNSLILTENFSGYQ